MIVDYDAHISAKHAFVAEYQEEIQEKRQQETLDALITEDDVADGSLEDVLAEERELLEELPLPGRPKD